MYIENNSLKKYLCIWLSLMFWITSIMITVGGLTRLTDSGLSITQWQLFSGIFPPFNESQWQNYFNLYKRLLALGRTHNDKGSASPAGLDGAADQFRRKGPSSEKIMNSRSGDLGMRKIQQTFISDLHPF